MSFTDENGVMDIFEGMMQGLFKEIMGEGIKNPIPRLEYIEVMNRFGTDRPDTRFGMELEDITELAGKSGFKVFNNAIEKGGIVKAIKVEKAAQEFSRKILDELSKSVAEFGAKGLAWIKVTDKGWQSSIAKFFSDAGKNEITSRLNANPDDLLLIVADRSDIVNQSLGSLRLDIARRLGVNKAEKYSFLWVTRFPLFEYDEDEGRLQSVHHPFTSPLIEDLDMLKEDPLKVRSRSYDLVLNGVEIGGGSVRIHDISMQEKIFSILGISKEEADLKFGFLLEALKYGAPPHAGMAIGFDRLVAIMCGVDSIREVIAFPKTSSASCLLTNAPSPVDVDQLNELGLKTI